MIKHVSIKAASCLDMINAVNAKISELDPGYVGAAECDEREPIEAGIDPTLEEPMVEEPIVGEPTEYIQAADGEITEAYIDEMMQYVADETVSEYGATCSWRVEEHDLVFILAGLEDDLIEEYRCPLEDLTGDVDSDIDYILNGIEPEGVEIEDIEPDEEDIDV